MGQILPKLTRREHEIIRKMQVWEKNVLMFFVRGGGFSVICDISPRPSLTHCRTSSLHSLLGHFGRVHCSITSLNFIVPPWDTGMINTQRNSRGTNLLLLFDKSLPNASSICEESQALLRR